MGRRAVKADGGYTQIPNHVLRDPTLPPASKLLYALLLSRCWGKEWCLSSQERLARDGAVSERACRNHLRNLENRGLIKTERRGNSRVNRYWILAIERQDLPLRSGRFCRSMEED